MSLKQLVERVTTEEYSLETRSRYYRLVRFNESTKEYEDAQHGLLGKIGILYWLIHFLEVEREQLYARIYGATSTKKGSNK